MPTNKAYVSIEGIGDKISLAQMQEKFDKALKKEIEETSSAEGKPAFDQRYFPADYNKKLDELHKETLNMVEALITDNLNTAIIGEAMDDVIKRAYISHNPFNAENPGAWGTFLEKAMFGAAGDERPTGDIDTFKNKLLPLGRRVEVKTKIKLGDLESKNPFDVGGITVYGLQNLTELEKQTVRNIAMIYKMMIKMQNFLYLSIVNKKFPSGREGIGFRAMILYTTLYLQGLMRILKGSIGYAGTVGTVKGAKTFESDKVTFSQHYDVTLEIASTAGDLFGGIERIAKIYMRRTDMIDEIHSGGISAHQFFARLKKLEGFIEFR